MRFTNNHAMDIRQVAPRAATPFLNAHWFNYVNIFATPVGGSGVGILWGRLGRTFDTSSLSSD